MKELFWGVVLIVLVGFGGLVYRNAVEHPLQQIACPLDAQVCPDGTAVGRTGQSCTFAPCPAPNVTLADVGIAFAVPAGFTAVETSDTSMIASYSSPASASSTGDAMISIRRYPIDASSTALAVIQSTAIMDPSGLPASVTSFTSKMLGNHRFTIVTVGRFEGTIDTAYYLARANDVLRFDAIDQNVSNWTDAHLDVSALPGHVALVKLLTTLQGQ
jgi:hypothetical protein